MSYSSAKTLQQVNLFRTLMTFFATVKCMQCPHEQSESSEAFLFSSEDLF